MKFKLKKLIALGLTLAMTCSALSMPAYALDVVDNPEVSTDGTNSVDSSTFETVEITTDETESETTTPTESGEETTTPPTTEGGGETTTPPTTEGGETTTPPTTEGGEETTTPPTTEGGEETTTPPTTEGGETTTPPTTEGGETTTPPTTEGGETTNEDILSMLGVSMLSMSDISLLEAYTTDIDVDINYVDQDSNVIGSKNITGNGSITISKDLFEDPYTDNNEKHYEFQNVTDNKGNPIESISAFEDKDGKKYIYYTVNESTALLYSTNGTIQSGVELQVNYIEYVNVTLNNVENGTANIDKAKVYSGGSLNLTATPNTGYKVSAIIGVDGVSMPIDGGTIEISFDKLNPDTLIEIQFAERTEEYTVTILNGGAIKYNGNSPISVSPGGKVSFENDTNKNSNFELQGIKINGEYISFEDEDVQHGVASWNISGVKRNYIKNDLTQSLPDYIKEKETTFDLYASYYERGILTYNQGLYKLEFYNIYNDITVEFVTTSTANDTRLRLDDVKNTQIYLYDSDGSVREFIKGNKKNISGGNRKYQCFYFTPNPGYDPYKAVIILPESSENIEISTSVTKLTEAGSEFDSYGVDKAKARGLEYGFVIKRIKETGTVENFSVKCNPIEYNVSYDIDGFTDSSKYTIEKGSNTIKLLGSKNELVNNDTEVLQGWKIGGKTYEPGDKFIIDESTYKLATEESGKFTFNFEAVTKDKTKEYKVIHYFEDENGEFTEKNTIVMNAYFDGAEGAMVFAPTLSEGDFSGCNLQGDGVNFNNQDYEYDPSNEGNTIYSEFKQGLELKVYYTNAWRVKYSYEDNGTTKELTLAEKFDRNGGATTKLLTAPNSTDDSVNPLHFAGWKIQDDTSGSIYIAGDIVALKQKTTVFKAVYYKDGKEYITNSSESKLGLKGGKVDDGSIFTGGIQSASGDDGSVYVYGSIGDDIVLQDYDEIGFVYSIYNNAPTTVGGFSYSDDTYVYKNVLIKSNGESRLEQAPEGSYFFGTIFTGTVPNSFIVTPYIVEKDSDKIIYGTPKEIKNQ